MHMTEWETALTYMLSTKVMASKTILCQVNIHKRAPDNPRTPGDITRKCRKDQAVGVWSYIDEKFQTGTYLSLTETAIWLAKLGLSAGDLENFFQAAEMMGWEDGLISQAVAQAQPYLTDEGDHRCQN